MFLKRGAIIQALLLLLTVIGVAYCFITSQLFIVQIQVVTIDDWKKQDYAKEATALWYQEFDEAITDATCYEYSVTLRNSCFFPADQVEIQIVPQAQDIVQYTSSVSYRLPAMETGVISTHLVTQSSSGSRQVRISYYILGIPVTIQGTTCE